MTTTFDYIDSDQKLSQFCAQIQSADWVAVDTEFMRERTYYAQLALVQIASPLGNACIDPEAVSNIDALIPLLRSASCLKIMHSASQDLEVLSQVLGVVPQPLFDTQIAAGFLGAADQISYAGLVKQILDIDLSKTQTRTNWLRRPLSPAQIEYAQLDVLYLEQIRQNLQAELSALGRLDWHHQECHALVERYAASDDPMQAWTRIKSVHKLDHLGQAIVQALCAWRERHAQEQDLPREWVLPKQAIFEIAQLKPSTADALSELEHLEYKLAQRHGSVLVQIVTQTKASDSSVQVTQPLDGLQRKSAKVLMDALRTSAEKLRITPALIANRSNVEALVRGERELALLKSWRAEQVGDGLLDLLLQQGR